MPRWLFSRGRVDLLLASCDVDDTATTVCFRRSRDIRRGENIIIYLAGRTTTAAEKRDSSERGDDDAKKRNEKVANRRKEGS